MTEIKYRAGLERLHFMKREYEMLSELIRNGDYGKTLLLKIRTLDSELKSDINSFNLK
ncbi:MAG TPA: hypothetical protein PLU58_13250 [Saprospiraceae bacterium]|jgi:hypothetical protein|nr:hypothetical protein [Saprospiraceae bacterium]HQW96769.1 hypothetical protein [Saprospiraceae bacterium]